MSLRATSHGDFQTLSGSAGKSPSLEDRMYKSMSMSSSNVTGGSRFGSGELEEVKGTARFGRRPVRAVRPLSALGTSGSFLQINHLQGELVRKRKECEDLKKENKYLSNEIHMERIMMRTENELTMRNLRNLNQELLAQVKESHRSRRCTTASRGRRCAPGRPSRRRRRWGRRSRAAPWRRPRLRRAGRTRSSPRRTATRLSQELQRLKKEHTEVQLSLARAEKSYFETKLRLDRASGERQSLLGENQTLEAERDDLRPRLRRLTQENADIKDKEVCARRRAAAAEGQRDTAAQALQEAQQERRRVEKESQERREEGLGWREKHQGLADVLRAQEDLKAQRQNKACQANIKSYFLCMTESDQRVKILKNPNGSARNFTEGDPVYISTPEPNPEDADRSPSRTMLRVSAPQQGRDPGPPHFGDLPVMGGERPDSAPPRRSRKVVEYFWIPTDEE
ncbi:calponin homology domain-containing protein DDB_G0272472 [Gadus morhua]|uniref:calponin homology domain-containing protein DDB_G0272472 n=1 Tax=Gadus morhua TaxID=8049 RepID=UPI0011B72270|nr:calponin homology domain-containing protein DDB_G0272472-like [Gadus morhua]